MTCKQLAKYLAGDDWALVDIKGLSTKEFFTWEKTDTTGYDGHLYLDNNKCFNFERGLWFDLWKCMWRKNQSIHQYHMKYVLNDIVKPFKLKILC